ncbi:MAG: HAMP domain-containing histidine kinase [Candidatus Thorarchaeota archaeon]|nr:HAMP domain-containing histidine kinase [Candidatus Thorarchaeota archaeon]
MGRQKVWKTRMKRLLQFLVEPSIEPSDQRSEIRMRFIAGLSLVVIPMFIVLQPFSSLFSDRVPELYILAALILVGYMLSRAGKLRAASSFLVAIWAIFPYAALLEKGFWSYSTVPVMMIWISSAIIITTYLLDMQIGLALIILQDVVFGTTVLLHPGVPSYDPNSFIVLVAPTWALSVLVYAGSWARQHYIELLHDKNLRIANARKEIEAYTSLLVHDIKNDLQVAEGSIELTKEQQLSPKTEHFIESTDAALERIGRLVKTLSKRPDWISTTIGEVLPAIIEHAERIHPNLEIKLTMHNESKNLVTTNRFFPLIFENLFRNASQHAGISPKVDVEVKQSDDLFIAEVSDDGPGLPPEVKNSLFQKGTKNGTDFSMGLYLVHRILELGDGTIEYRETEPTGATFRIEIPVSNL